MSACRSEPGAPEAGPSPVRRALTDSAAVIAAYLPFGLTLGATLAGTTLPPWVAWASSPLLFNGAAQLVAVTLLDGGAGAVLVVLAALVISARMLLYGASLAPYAAEWPRRWRWLGGYVLTDPVYALAIGRFGRPDRGGGSRARLVYYLTVGVTLYTAWQLLTGAGVLLGGLLPQWLHVELAAPLTFLLLLLPMLTGRAAYAAAAAAGAVAVSAMTLPLGLGLVVGAVAGIAAGVAVDARRVRTRQSDGARDA
ncbi:AzlC family ABC transporter permease [Pseudonocardia kujensis]|uniref:AzlC family ABC transporter permease n=1 Tax=Pseudonocardia kujensis TaxID=1128675 RepID=UPI001E430D10|nr:AzlC family ABC transporter permease [Pseudonocardia kujensis]MCE0766831.1 AzlC family ABC transporter permease [Pseudonocardia kujensis]